VVVSVCHIEGIEGGRRGRRRGIIYHARCALIRRPKALEGKRRHGASNHALSLVNTAAGSDPLVAANVVPKCAGPAMHDSSDHSTDGGGLVTNDQGSS